MAAPTAGVEDSVLPRSRHLWRGVEMNAAS
jgi:hypothetical protein